MSKGTIQIETDRLLLRQHVAGDAAVLHQSFGLDPEMFRYSGWNPYATQAAAEEAVRHFMDSYKDEHFYGWAIESDGRLVGTIGAYDYDSASNTIEIGCSIERTSWGKGFASEAIEAVLDYLTEQEGIKCVTAWCAADNIGSRRIMEKAGMKCIRTERDALEIDGKEYDKITYEINVAHEP